MSNKTNIEEDIKILKNITKQDFSNPMGWTGYYDSELKELQQAIENILADRERLEKENEELLEVEISVSAHNKIEELTKENFKLKTELENKQKEYQDTYKDVREELKELQVKANKYDSLVFKIKDRIKSVDKCYQDLIEPYFDKNINMINASYMSKKEKEEFINKRNCLVVQKATFEEVLELLDTE